MSLKLIQKVPVDWQGARRASFKWIGPDLNDLVASAELISGTHPGQNPARESNRGRKQSLLVEVAKEAEDRQKKVKLSYDEGQTARAAVAQSAPSNQQQQHHHQHQEVARKLPFTFPGPKPLVPPAMQGHHPAYRFVQTQFNGTLVPFQPQHQHQVVQQQQHHHPQQGIRVLSAGQLFPRHVSIIQAIPTPSSMTGGHPHSH